MAKPDWRELYAACDADRAAGRVDAAIARCEEVLRDYPAWAAAMNQLGWLLVMNGRAAEGVRHLKRATDLDAEYGDAMFNLALGYTVLLQLDDAVRWFRHALSAKFLTDRASTWWNLSRLYEERGWAGRALQAAARAAEVEPEGTERRAVFTAAVERLEAAGAVEADEPEVPIATDVRKLAEQGRVETAVALIAQCGLDAEQAVLLRASVYENAGDAMPGRARDEYYAKAEAALREYASWASSGAEGLGRMYDVNRVVRKRTGTGDHNDYR